MRATLSKSIPYGLRSQVPSGMGHQVSQTYTHRTDGSSSAGFDTGNLRNTQHSDSPWPRLERPRAYLYLHAPADFRIKDRTVSQGQDLSQTTAGRPRTAQEVLGSAPVGQRVLCRIVRYHHRRDNYAIHRVAGRRCRETRRQFYYARSVGKSASARLCEKTYRLIGGRVV